MSEDASGKTTEAGTEARAREDYYDTVIAPRLRELVKDCHEHGLSAVCCVEYDRDNLGRGRSLWMQPDASLAIHIVDWAAQAGNNVDSLIMAIMRSQRVKPHSSMFLSMLGLPCNPDRAEAENDKQRPAAAEKAK